MAGSRHGRPKAAEFHTNDVNRQPYVLQNGAPIGCSSACLLHAPSRSPKSISLCRSVYIKRVFQESKIYFWRIRITYVYANVPVFYLSVRINKNRIRCNNNNTHYKEGKQFQQSLQFKVWTVTQSLTSIHVSSVLCSASYLRRLLAIAVLHIAHINWCVICRWTSCWRGWRSSSPVFHVWD